MSKLFSCCCDLETIELWKGLVPYCLLLILLGVSFEFVFNWLSWVVVVLVVLEVDEEEVGDGDVLDEVSCNEF